MTRAMPEINDGIRLTNPDLAENVIGPFILKYHLHSWVCLMSYVTLDQICVYNECIDSHICTVQTLRGIQKCY